MTYFSGNMQNVIYSKAAIRPLNCEDLNGVQLASVWSHHGNEQSKISHSLSVPFANNKTGGKTFRLQGSSNISASTHNLNEYTKKPALLDCGGFKCTWDASAPHVCIHEFMHAHVLNWTYLDTWFKFIKLLRCSDACVFMCVGRCVVQKRLAALPGALLPAPQGLVKQWGWKEEI